MTRSPLPAAALLLLALLAACAPAAGAPRAHRPQATATLSAEAADLEAQAGAARATITAGDMAHARETLAVVEAQQARIAEATAIAAATASAYAQSQRATADALANARSQMAATATAQAVAIEAEQTRGALSAQTTAQAMQAAATIGAATVTAEAQATARVVAAGEQKRADDRATAEAFAGNIWRTGGVLLFVTAALCFMILLTRAGLAIIAARGVIYTSGGTFAYTGSGYTLLAPPPTFAPPALPSGREPGGPGLRVTDARGTREYPGVDDAARQRAALRLLCLRLVRLAIQLSGNDGSGSDFPTSEQYEAAGMWPAQRQDAVDALRPWLEVARGRHGYTRVSEGRTLHALYMALACGDVSPVLPPAPVARRVEVEAGE